MKKLFIIANWKSHKTQDEANAWLQELRIKSHELGDKTVVVCPPFTSLPLLSEEIKKQALSIQLGAQDVSQFDEGPFTGEISGEQEKDFCTYVLIGHSERRKNFGETDEIVVEKVKRAIDSGLTPILCISEMSQIHNSSFLIHNSKIMIAYEPLAAIGSGEADSPEHAEDMAKKIKETCGDMPVLYGGSVTAKNVHSFVAQENVDGVLVGTASLDAKEFSAIIQHA